MVRRQLANGWCNRFRMFCWLPTNSRALVKWWWPINFVIYVFRCWYRTMSVRSKETVSALSITLFFSLYFLHSAAHVNAGTHKHRKTLKHRKWWKLSENCQLTVATIFSFIHFNSIVSRDSFVVCNCAWWLNEQMAIHSDRQRNQSKSVNLVNYRRQPTEATVCQSHSRLRCWSRWIFMGVQRKR